MPERVTMCIVREAFVATLCIIYMSLALSNNVAPAWVLFIDFNVITSFCSTKKDARNANATDKKEKPSQKKNGTTKRSNSRDLLIAYQREEHRCIVGRYISCGHLYLRREGGRRRHLNDVNEGRNRCGGVHRFVDPNRNSCWCCRLN